MFNEETLFILGAGASWYYGYPLGKDLILAIIHAISSDLVYVPLTKEQEASVRHDTGRLNGMKFSLADVGRGIQNVDLESIDGKHSEQFVVARVLDSLKTYFPSIVLAQVKMSQITELAALKDALKQFDPVTIDAFLNNHQSYAHAGKAMIIYELLKREDKSSFSIGYKRKKEPWETEESTVKDNWYSYLLADMMSSCVNQGDIVNNNLNIVTFNYDLSLDYILQKKLSGVEMFKEDGVAQNYIYELVHDRIYHVYGKLYKEEPHDVYGAHHATPSNQDAKTNSKRLIKALSSIESIKLIDERLSLHEDDVYRSLIEKARKIIIIGFGFDRDNLNVLGFPSQPTSYNEIFKGKELLYMDFNGAMRGLAEQFEYLKQKFKFRVTRSVATRVIDAYQNDFKIRLYQEIT